MGMMGRGGAQSGTACDKAVRDRAARGGTVQRGGMRQGDEGRNSARQDDVQRGDAAEILRNGIADGTKRSDIAHAAASPPGITSSRK